MSFYRNIVWYFHGLSHYTKAGYEEASKAFKPDALATDLTGRSFIVTGANSGIGKETTLELVKRGATVHMVCRDVARAEAAKSEIAAAATNGAQLYVHQLDMSAPSAIKTFVKEFLEKETKLDGLVNNAGCMINKLETTPEGVEKNFATNTLGTFILTTELIPLLQKGDNARVITVSSGGMLVQKLDVEDPQCLKMSPFDGTMAYAQNKRQQVVMTSLLAKEYASTGISFYSMHPGWADTPAVRDAMPGFYEKMKDRLRSATQGADTVVWLCASKDISKGDNGQFFEDRKVVPIHLPLAWTRSSAEEEAKFLKYLTDLASKL
eukprot:Opistho-2@53962